MRRLLGTIAFCSLGLALYAQAPRLSASSIGPKDSQDLLLALPSAQRVSLVASSSAGVPISLHDKMEGQIAQAGIEGEQDGRIDATLDSGEYRLRLGSRDASGKAVRLEARAFREIDGRSSYPILVPGAVESASLADLQSASYWIELREDGAVEVEALGRDLALFELWREGQYLVGSYPVREERQVEEGRPQGYACASVPAKAGLYLARLYGGPSRAWAKDDGKRPLLVRSGFLSLPIGGRLDLSVSGFGRDFVLVEGVDAAVLSRKAKGLASMSALPYAPGVDRLASGDRASIEKNSISLSSSLGLRGGRSLLRIEAKSGDALCLDAYTSLSEETVPASELKSGGLLTVMAPRSLDPELPLTGLAYLPATGKDSKKAIVVRDFSLPLSGASSFRGRCNLGARGDRSLILRVEEAGDYAVAEKAGTGQAAASYSIQSFGANFGTSDYSRSYDSAKAASFSLVRGYYLLSISARSIGVLDFAIFKGGLAKSGAAELAKEPAPSRQSYSWSLDADPGAKDLYLIAGAGPARGSGYSFSAYPLPLDRGLALELGPKENLDLPASIAQRASFIAASAPGSVLLGGQALPGGSSAAGSAPRAPGRLALSLRNPQAQAAAAAFSARASFDDLPPPSPSPFGSGIEPLEPGKAAWRDFKRSESAFYAFEVKESAVYVVETLGRLSTSLSLRTASRLGLFDAQANGYGKNAAIRAWLRPGQYYVMVAAFDRSAGRAGIRMSRVPLAAAVPLAPGAVDRRAVAADQAAAFTFSLASEEDLELRSTGLSGPYSVRLEDGQGFIAYRGQGQARLRLPVGAYRLFSLPVSIDTNRLTWIRRLRREAPAAAPDGTKALALNAGSLQATWKEGGAPDSYSFTSPAALEARLQLPEAFDAVLEGPEGKRSLAPADRGSLALQKGAYRLSVRPREKANQLDYSIGVSTATLAPGLSGISVPGSKGSSALKVSVPEDGFYELWSLGRCDVSARLFRDGPGAKPELVAEADDNGPDWNFDIVRKLKAGSYRLEVSSLTGGGEAVELYLTSRNARSLPGAATPFEAAVQADEAGVVLGIEARSGEGLYLLSAAGDVPASLRLYRGDELLASGEGSVALPLGSGVAYSLYAWTPLPAKLSISAKRLPEKEASIAEPFSLEAGAVLRLRNAQALSAVVTSGSLLVSPGLETPCYDPGSSPFSTREGGGWAWAPEAAARAEPLALGEREGAVLDLADYGQGFTAGSADKALLVSADTRGQFRCGVSAAPKASAGPAPFDWDASATWSQGSLALLPPGQWKARVWDGESSAGILRRTGVGIDLFDIRALPSAALGSRGTIAIPGGGAIAMDVPASTLSILMGENLVLSAWKDGEAIATRASIDGRSADTLALKACKVYVANRGASDSSLRFAVLPAASVSEDELSAARPFESVSLPPEGIRLNLKASPGDLLCLAGDGFEAELEAADGSYYKIAHPGAALLFSSIPASSGSLRISRAQGLARVYLAKAGKEVEGLLMQEGGSGRELKDAALLSGKGDSFRLKLEKPGYVDLSCQGPGFLSLSGAGIERRVSISGSREDMHLFAYLPAGDFLVWQRPARGAASGGILRADRIESGDAEAARGGRKAFIGAREYQAWSFEAKAEGKVGVGVKADRDGLRAFLYDERQGLVASGSLVFADLEAGKYLLVVKGLDASPMEYELVLEGLDGSRLGVPPEIVDEFKKAGGAPASIAVPMHSRGAPGRRAGAAANQSPSAEASDEEEYSEDQEYSEEEEYSEDEGDGEYEEGEADYEDGEDYESEGEYDGE